MSDPAEDSPTTEARPGGPRAVPTPPTIPGYELGAVVGRGATGVVYRARQLIVDREVAIKVLHPELTGNVRLVRRLQREAKTTARLAHPNVVSAIDMGRADGTWWYAMEFVDGPSLAERLRSSGPLREREALRLFIPIADALEHLREQGVVHRDIKPANILLDRNGARLADLGLAFIGEDPGLTSGGGTLGTPHYISPEQAVDASEADTRSDIWSFGATLFHAVCGRPPFSGNSAAEILSAVLYARVPDPRRVAPGLSRGLALVLRKCLSRDPNHRYQTPRELAEDLERVRERRTPHVRRSRLDPVAGRGRRLRLAFALAIALELLIFGGWALLHRSSAGGEESGTETDSVAARVDPRLEAIADDLGGGPREAGRALAELDRMRPDLGAELVPRWAQLRAQAVGVLRDLVRAEQERAGAMLEQAFEAGDFVWAAAILDEELPARLEERTGLSVEDLEGRGVEVAAWADARHALLRERIQEVSGELRAGLAAWSESHAMEAERLAQLQRWDEAFQELAPEPDSITGEAGFADVRLPADALALLIDEASGTILLRKRLELTRRWRELDDGLARQVRARSALLEEELVSGPPRKRAADALARWFTLELQDRGLSRAHFPGPAAGLAVTSLDVLERERQRLLGREEELLEQDARAALERTARLADAAWERRAAAEVERLWGAYGQSLAEPRERVVQAWPDELAALAARRAEEARLVGMILDRAGDRLRALDGGRVPELRVDDIWYMDASIRIQGDPLEDGFRVGGRERPVRLSELDADQVFALAGLDPAEDRTPREGIAVAAFLFHAGDLEGARAALRSRAPEEEGDALLAADLERRILDGLEAQEAVRAERAAEAAEYLARVFDSAEQQRAPDEVEHTIDLLLDGYPEVAAVQLRRTELRALRDELRRRPEPTPLERIRSRFGPGELEEVGLRRVRLGYSFDATEVGAWDRGSWVFDGAGWLLDEETPDWRELRLERGPVLQLGAPLEADRVDLQLWVETTDGPSQLLLVEVAGFHVALVGPGLPGVERGARLLVGTEQRDSFLDRLQSGQGHDLRRGLEPAAAHRLRITTNRRSGSWAVELDGAPLGNGRERAPRGAEERIGLESWEPVRLVRLDLELGRAAR